MTHYSGRQGKRECSAVLVKGMWVVTSPKDPDPALMQPLNAMR